MTQFFPENTNINARLTRKIFSYLEPKHLFSNRAVCKDWKLIIEGQYQKPLHLLFEETALQFSQKAAIYFESKTISFFELNAQANQLAHYLQSLRLIPDMPIPYAAVPKTVRIGLYLPQGFHFSIAMLAVMKAGYAFVPIPNDEEISLTRLHYIIEDVSPQVILASKKQAQRVHLALKNQACHLIFLEDIEYVLSSLSSDNLRTQVLPDALAYIMYTSGSTGNPKGVMIRHAGLPDCMHSIKFQFEITENSRITNFASDGFDANIMERFLAFLYGGTLFIVPKKIRLDHNALTEFIEENKITFSILTPSVLGLLEGKNFKHLKAVISTGEKAYAKLIQELAGKLLFGNGYGQTEVTIATLVAILLANQPIHIGNEPILGLEIFVLEIIDDDASLEERQAPRLLKGGEEGELYITGGGVGPGYWGKEMLTKNRFRWIINPKNPNEKIYVFQTGDKARLINVDGQYQIEIIGRLGRQIKVHGKLICPEEIEDALKNHESLSLSNGKRIKTFTNVYVDTCSFSAERPPKIIAFLFVNPDAVSPDINDLSDFVKDQLTDTMIPTRWIIFPENVIPEVVNEKIDRCKLWKFLWKNKAIYSIQLCRGYREQPSNSPEEETLRQLWCQTLYFSDSNIVEKNSNDEISDLDIDFTPQNLHLRIQPLLQQVESVYTPKLDDNFFYLGGTSVQCARLLNNVGRVFNITITINEFLLNPTLGYLLRRLYWKKEKDIPTSRVMVSLDEKYPIDQMLPDGTIPQFWIHSLVGCPLLDYGYILANNNGKYPLFGLRSPGLDNPALMGDSFDELADIYISLIEKVYQGKEIILVGWSGGGLLSIAMQQKLILRGKQVMVIMFDTNSPVSFQQMSLKTFNGFFSKLLYEDEINGIHHRIQPILNKGQFITRFQALPSAISMREKIIRLFEGLIDDIKHRPNSKCSPQETKDAIGLLTTVECILLSALKQKVPVENKQVILFAATDSTKRFGTHLFWPKEWEMRVESVVGNHFFPHDKSALAKLDFFNYIDKMIVEFKKEEKSRASLDLIEEYRAGVKQCISTKDFFVNLILIDASTEEKRELERVKKFISLNPGNERQVMDVLKNIRSTTQPILLEDELSFSIEKISIKTERRLCIKGLPGTGKTSLLLFIHKAWCSNATWLKCYDVAFYIPLRFLLTYDVNGVPLSETEQLAKILFAYVEQEHHKIGKGFTLTELTLRKIIEDDSLIKLFIVDGLDEIQISHKNRKLNKLVSLFLKQNLVVTSSRSDLPIPDIEFDKTLAIVGLKDKEIELFIYHYFGDDLTLAKLFIQYIEKNPFLKSIVTIPLDLKLLCHIFQEAHTILLNEDNVPVIFNVTYLYQQFEFFLLKNQMIIEMGGEGKVSLGEFKVYQSKKEVRYFLACLAFRAFAKNSVLINRFTINHAMQELAEIFPDLYKQIDRDLYLEVVKAGFLKCVSQQGELVNRTCYFFHAKAQAYFTALYIVFAWIDKRALYDAEDEVDVCIEEFIKKYSFAPHYKQVWQFVSGLLSNMNPELCKKFLMLLRENETETVWIHSKLLISTCLNECYQLKKIACREAIHAEVNTLTQRILTNVPRANRFTNQPLFLLGETLRHCPAIANNKGILTLIESAVSNDDPQLQYQGFLAISLIGLYHHDFVVLCHNYFKSGMYYENKLLALQALRAMSVNDPTVLATLHAYLTQKIAAFENELRLAVVTVILDLSENVETFLLGILAAVMHQGFSEGEEPDNSWRHDIAMQIVNTDKDNRVLSHLVVILHDENTEQLIKTSILYILAKANGYAQIIYQTAYDLLQLPELSTNGEFKSDALDDILYALSKISLTNYQKTSIAELILKHLLQFERYSQWALMHTLGLLSQIYADSPELFDLIQLKMALKEQFGSEKGCNLAYLQLLGCAPIYKTSALHEVLGYLSSNNMWNRFAAIEVLGQWSTAEEKYLSQLKALSLDSTSMVREKSIETLGCIAFECKEVIEQGFIFFEKNQQDKQQLALTILENAWHNNYLNSIMVDRLVTILLARINKIEYKVPLLRFLLDILLKYTVYCQTVLPQVLVIASKALEETDFSVENENINYAWQMLSNFDLTLWLADIAAMLPEKISFSPLLSKTSMASIVNFTQITETLGLELLFYKAYNEGLPLIVEENKLMFFEQNKLQTLSFSTTTLEKLNEIFARFKNQEEPQVSIKSKFFI